MLITVIGRGHSGTRAISHTLSASGVFMGDRLNRSGDLLPPQAMYEACRVLAPHVRWLGDLRWDFSALHTMPIPARFTELIQAYLARVLDAPAPRKGWKIPETTLVFPWIVRMFPDAYYIHWVRDPRDCILGRHLTDDLLDFGIPYPETDASTEEGLRRRRAISWLYQHELVKATPKPRRWLLVRFEDFILRQAETLERLSAFLGFPLAAIPVRPESVGRWRTVQDPVHFDFLAPAMHEYNYHENSYEV